MHHQQCAKNVHEANPSCLANWVDKNPQKEGRIAEKQISKPKLNEIGFEWTLILVSWDDRYKELVVYEKKFGDCNVPRGVQRQSKFGELGYGSMQEVHKNPEKYGSVAEQLVQE